MSRAAFPVHYAPQDAPAWTAKSEEVLTIVERQRGAAAAGVRASQRMRQRESHAGEVIFRSIDSRRTASSSHVES
jgi:hypothetical protein